jgi:hypothetical protein
MRDRRSRSGIRPLSASYDLGRMAAGTNLLSLSGQRWVWATGTKDITNWKGFAFACESHLQTSPAGEGKKSATQCVAGFGERKVQTPCL